jgi:hypothetical protein
MQERTKAVITIGILAYFASVWVLFEYMKNNHIFLDAIITLFVLLVVMLVLSYVIITLLEWVNVFDLKTNAILALLVLVGFMINLSVYLFSR